MITLCTLGATGLTTEDGRDLDGLLRQPKRLALLIYLASPHPGTWHRRESIVALFWPSFAASQGRVALRNALYVIRQEIGADVLRTRGDDEVSVDPAMLCSDSALMQADFREGRPVEALERYAGDFLPGFYVSDADGFDRWVDDERRRLRDIACDGARRLAREREASGDLAGAVTIQRRLVEIDLDDESSARTLMSLLDRLGDRGQALAVFDRLLTRLQSHFGAQPASETVQIAETIRAKPARAPLRAEATTATDPAADIDTGPAASTTKQVTTQGEMLRSRRAWWYGGAVVLVALAIAVFALRRPELTTGTPSALVVLPMEDATGDPANGYVATGLTEEVATRLTGFGTIRIRSAARAGWPAAIKDSLHLIGSRFGATVLLRSRLTRVGDSLQADAQLVDATNGQARDVGTVRFVVASLRDAASRFAAGIAGTLYRVPLVEMPHKSSRDIDPESYRLALAGWHQLLGAKDEEGARELFMRATDADRLYARAWSGLSSTWAAATTNGLVPFDDGYARAEQAARRALAIDSLEGTAFANLGVLTALKARDLSAGEPYFRRAIALEPANPEVFMIYSATLRFAGLWERAQDQTRVARQLDPLTAYYAGMEANTALCAARPDDALRLFRVAVELDHKDRAGLLGIANALARLHRWDEAIAQLGVLAKSRSDTALTLAAASAHGEAGYWTVKHLEGKALLARRTAMASKRWVAPYLLGVAEIGAGHLDRGLDLLESELRSGSRMLYKLPCNPEIDEVRAMPRFNRLMQAAGSLPAGGTSGNP